MKIRTLTIGLLLGAVAPAQDTLLALTWSGSAMHINATRNTGATADDVKEVFLMVAVYAGVPAANTAVRVAKDVYAIEGEL